MPNMTEWNDYRIIKVCNLEKNNKLELFELFIVLDNAEEIEIYNNI